MTTSTSANAPFRAVTQAGRAAIDAIAADPTGTLLACDFDGTLAPIVADPSASRMLDGSRAALAELGPRLGRIAIVTGRPVAAVRDLGRLDGQAGLERVLVLGQYGQERWDAATGSLDVPPEPTAVREAIAELEGLLSRDDLPAVVAGTSLEDKGRAVGVHTRRAADPAAALDWLTEPVTGIAERHGMAIEPGRMVLELRSATTSKGDALRSVVEAENPRVVVMCGDDLGDIPAFEYVHELPGGVCVVSGSPEQPQVAEHADVLCDGPEGVAAFLQALAEATR